MNNLPQNNLTLSISENDLAAATARLTLGSGPTEWGNSRSDQTQPTGVLRLAPCVRMPLRVGRVEAAFNPIADALHGIVSFRTRTPIRWHAAHRVLTWHRPSAWN